MAGDVKIRARLSGGVAEIKALIPHPMETGTRRDADGTVVPAHYIQTVSCKRNGSLVLTAEWGPAVSKNPFFSFSLKNAVAGDVIAIDWVDNQNGTGSGELVLK